MAEVFNLSWNGSSRIQFSCIYNCLHARGKMTMKDRNKNRPALIFSHSGNLKTWIKCQGLNYTPPPPHPAAAYHWFCQSRSLTGYATVFFCCCCFLSMEFIAELPYKSLRFSGCFHTVFCFTIILTAV